ncbi:amino acid racemase [Altererythrobacter sp. CC-YST694]|uniref:aspartate/glutamate racemase family protein n=1 Tax=Altererythrobacter sp. CC-YST694 TaxID=2755038 RepID=UPI001D02BCDC|nr:amino acid racemase [Altererythrobacter sp. CC-YST694]MCB5424850.1 amino acid racemase [Altererythrobacter sp. CC-YST694]
MRKLGLIGGMSWVSTRTYYDRINRYVQARAPFPASAPLLIESLDFSLVYRVTEDQGWEEAAQILIASARRLEQAGAGALAICANSMHKVYDEVAASVDIPIFHIAECVGEKMKADGVTTAALFGTRNVTTESFYRKRLVAHGVDLLPPDMDHVEQLDRIIYDELMQGKVTRDAERKLKTMITVKEQAGARAIVLACTELDMVVDVDANVLPIYDSLRIHAEKAAEWILGAE